MSKPWFLVGPSGAGWDYPKEVGYDCRACNHSDECSGDECILERMDKENEELYRASHEKDMDDGWY